MSLLIPNEEKKLVLHQSSKAPRELTELTNVAVLPGAFNPLHTGHQALRRVAAELLQQDVIYELSVANVAKSLLTEQDVTQRIQQFDGCSVAVTRAPRFTDKSFLFRGCCFVVGVDTAERILSPRFYDNDVAVMHAALQQLRDMENQFLVGGRLGTQSGQAKFLGVDALNVPPRFRDMFIGIPESRFREDISSTQIRNDV